MGMLLVEITEELTIGNAELAAPGEAMRIIDRDSTCAKRESLNYQVAGKDILRRLDGLIATGKAGFDHVRQFRDSVVMPQPRASAVCRRRPPALA